MKAPLKQTDHSFTEPLKCTPATYVGSSPTALELASKLNSVNMWEFFKKGNTDPVFLVFRRSSAGSGSLDDFAIIQLT